MSIGCGTNIKAERFELVIQVWNEGENLVSLHLGRES